MAGAVSLGMQYPLLPCCGIITGKVAWLHGKGGAFKVIHSFSLLANLGAIIAFKKAILLLSTVASKI